jgi:hypothetical protein
LRHSIPLLFLTVAIAGCGSSAATPVPTVETTRLYTDAQHGFSFRYPSNWSVPKNGGKIVNVAGVSTYELDLTIPQDAAQVSVTVDADVVQFPAFADGKTAPDPNAPSHTFQYFHSRVAGWPAMVIRRFTGKQITEEDTVTNTRTRSYDVRMLTATPPFSSTVTQGYQRVVKSLKVPFS